MAELPDCMNLNMAKAEEESSLKAPPNMENT
jgi:hypothetical protein